MPLKIILKFCEAVQPKAGFSLLSIGGNGMLWTMLSLVIKSSIQTVLQLFNSVEWDWNAIRDRGWFFLTTWLFSQKQGHILGCPSIVLHYTIAVVLKRVIKKKQLMQSSFLVVDRKHDRFVLLCVSPFHGRAISERHRNQAVCTSLFCWHGSLKSLWPPETGREGLKSIDPLYILRDAWEGYFVEPNQISLPRLWVVL